MTNLLLDGFSANNPTAKTNVGISNGCIQSYPLKQCSLSSRQNVAFSMNKTLREAKYVSVVGVILIHVHIVPTITQVSSWFVGYTWLDTNIEFEGKHHHAPTEHKETLLSESC